VTWANAVIAHRVPSLCDFAFGLRRDVINKHRDAGLKAAQHKRHDACDDFRLNLFRDFRSGLRLGLRYRIRAPDKPHGQYRHSSRRDIPRTEDFAIGLQGFARPINGKLHFRVIGFHDNAGLPLRHIIAPTQKR
jgi:hypothetical protein